MSSLSNSHTLKFVLIGESGTGKSSLCMRYADDYYTDSFISTIGVDFKIKTVQLDEKLLKIQIWDTAGQERFRNITRAYYRGAHGVLITYDSTNRMSFERVQEWFNDVTHSTSQTAAIILVATKIDKVRERQVSSAEGKALAAKINNQFIETSSKDNVGVEDAFLQITRSALRNTGGLTNDKEKKIFPSPVPESQPV
eukprot:TRINITY_DN3190_c0_g1_i1.p1 TRINITY_DN3190_c0_g1~~TRINITY_DN3190_c0_g1_i1.p1  ORF type:complete len:197 (-),score=30.83 TRINITY_DN3190_c0_g1_i1:63-653(-)